MDEKLKLAYYILKSVTLCHVDLTFEKFENWTFFGNNKTLVPLINSYSGLS